MRPQDAAGGEREFPEVHRSAGRAGVVVIGMMTYLAAITFAGMWGLDGWYEMSALIFTACAYGLMLLPAMGYRVPVGSGEIVRVETE